MQRYRAFVAEGKNQPSPWGQLTNQVFLGSEHFVSALQARLEAGKDLSEIPVRQRRVPAKPLAVYAARNDRDAAIADAYASGGYSMKEIGDHFGLHYSYISRIIRRIENTR
jgi:hypothetical protein